MWACSLAADLHVRETEAQKWEFSPKRPIIGQNHLSIFHACLGGRFVRSKLSRVRLTTTPCRHTWISAFYASVNHVGTTMPATLIDYKDIHKALNSNSQPATESEGCIISTPFGLSLLEIQGELNLPQHAPDDTDGLDPEYVSNFAKVNDTYEAVQFGRLEFDEKDPQNAVLFIGKSQRLLGSVVTLNNPLGVLRVPTDGTTDSMKFVDLIYKKVIFKQRPLPIM